MKRLALVALLATAVAAAHAAPAGSDTVAEVRELRKQAAALSGADAPAADVQRATALLEDAQHILKAAEQATGNPTLRQESYNNLLPLAAIYSRQGSTWSICPR